jgi:hypothetical protein
MQDVKLESTAPVLTLDAAGEFAAGATVLAAYWPRTLPHQVMLKTRPAGRRELVVPIPSIEKALAILTEWAEMRTGASVSARLLQRRIREAALVESQRLQSASADAG